MWDIQKSGLLGIRKYQPVNRLIKTCISYKEYDNIAQYKKQQKNIEEIILRYLSGWAIHIIASSSTGNRTPVSAVRGRRLNRLTIEPYLFYIDCIHNLTYQHCILTCYIDISSSTGNRTPVSAVRGRRLNRLTIEPYQVLYQYTLASQKKQAFFSIFFKLFNLYIFYVVFRQFVSSVFNQTVRFVP